MGGPRWCDQNHFCVHPVRSTILPAAPRDRKVAVMNRATIVRRTSTFTKCIALLLCSTVLALAEGSDRNWTSAQSQPSDQTSAKPEQSTAPSSTIQPTARGFLLEDSTPVKLRINRTVSSADAQVGDNVDFEV